MYFLSVRVFSCVHGFLSQIWAPWVGFVVEVVVFGAQPGGACSSRVYVYSMQGAIESARRIWRHSDGDTSHDGAGPRLGVHRELHRRGGSHAAIHAAGGGDDSEMGAAII